MNFSRIVFGLCSIIFLVSCENGVPKKNDVQQKENQLPSIESRKTERPLPKLDRQIPVEKSLDKEVRKKNLKAIDTLRPVVAIP